MATIKQSKILSNIQLFIRTSDKKGRVIYLQKSESLMHLQQTISKKTKIANSDMILYNKGKQVIQIEQLEDKDIVHVINKRNIKKGPIKVKIKNSKIGSSSKLFQIDSQKQVGCFIEQQLSQYFQKQNQLLLLVYVGKSLQVDKNFTLQLVEDGCEIIYLVCKLIKRDIKNQQVNKNLHPKQIQQQPNLQTKQQNIPIQKINNTKIIQFQPSKLSHHIQNQKIIQSSEKEQQNSLKINEQVHKTTLQKRQEIEPNKSIEILSKQDKQLPAIGDIYSHQQIIEQIEYMDDQESKPKIQTIVPAEIIDQVDIMDQRFSIQKIDSFQKIILKQNQIENYNVSKSLELICNLEDTNLREQQKLKHPGLAYEQIPMVDKNSISFSELLIYQEKQVEAKQNY